ncbi:MAG: phosphate ABC transporter permease [Oscillatoria sp. PMC 1051.18]|nr:phosphate ABC transporter permease [Oscillatoria sp. PMC 1050.18]MEC5031874.1 phosphate ABC transporter permease [Oscillatoria sp. PMC 1051.18]
MLFSLSREKFEEIVPLIATGAQYIYYWGKVRDILRRVLISVVGVVVVLLLGKLFGEGVDAIVLLLGVIAGLYWFWSPIYVASRRNAEYRRYQYSGFLRGRVLDVFVSEESLGEEETVNKRGELVIVENLERRINLEIGDETGFRTFVQAPLRRIHKSIKPGQVAELLVLSNVPDLSRIDRVTDAYLPSNNLWVGEYPILRRDIFALLSSQIGYDDPYSRRRDRRPNYPTPRRR